MMICNLGFPIIDSVDIDKYINDTKIYAAVGFAYASGCLKFSHQDDPVEPISKYYTERAREQLHPLGFDDGSYMYKGIESRRFAAVEAVHSDDICIYICVSECVLRLQHQTITGTIAANINFGGTNDKQHHHCLLRTFTCSVFGIRSNNRHHTNPMYSRRYLVDFTIKTLVYQI